MLSIKKFFLPFLKAVDIFDESKAEYCIRIITKGDTKELLPMVRANGLFHNWLPIVRVYNRYVAMPYELDGGMSQEECMKHIKGYKEQLRLSRITVEYNVIKDEIPVNS